MFENLRSLRKPLYGISLAIGILSMIFSWVILLVAYSTVDIVEKSANQQIDATVGTITAVEGSISTIESEIDAADSTFTSIESSLESLEISFKSAGSTLSTFGNGLKGLTLLGVGGTYGDQFVSAGQELQQSGSQLGIAANSMQTHKSNIAELKANLGEVKDNLSNQRAKIANLKATIRDFFSNVKLGIIIMVVLLNGAFIVLGINSLAGLME